MHPILNNYLYIVSYLERFSFLRNKYLEPYEALRDSFENSFNERLVLFEKRLIHISYIDIKVHNANAQAIK